MVQRISPARAVGRHLATLLSSTIFFIGYLIQPFTRKRQALHDIIASTSCSRNRSAIVNSRCAGDVVDGAIGGAPLFAGRLVAEAVVVLADDLFELHRAGGFARPTRGREKIERLAARSRQRRAQVRKAESGRRLIAALKRLVAKPAQQRFSVRPLHARRDERSTGQRFSGIKRR